jgi:hypothetical protein
MTITQLQLQATKDAIKKISMGNGELKGQFWLAIPRKQSEQPVLLATLTAKDKGGAKLVKMMKEARREMGKQPAARGEIEFEDGTLKLKTDKGGGIKAKFGRTMKLLAKAYKLSKLSSAKLIIKTGDREEVEDAENAQEIADDALPLWVRQTKALDLNEEEGDYRVSQDEIRALVQEQQEYEEMLASPAGRLTGMLEESENFKGDLSDDQLIKLIDEQELLAARAEQEAKEQSAVIFVREELHGIKASDFDDYDAYAQAVDNIPTLTGEDRVYNAFHGNKSIIREVMANPEINNNPQALLTALAAENWDGAELSMKLRIQALRNQKGDILEEGKTIVILVDNDLVASLKKEINAPVVQLIPNGPRFTFYLEMDKPMFRLLQEDLMLHAKLSAAATEQYQAKYTEIKDKMLALSELDPATQQSVIDPILGQIQQDAGEMYEKCVTATQAVWDKAKQDRAEYSQYVVNLKKDAAWDAFNVAFSAGVGIGLALETGGAALIVGCVHTFKALTSLVKGLITACQDIDSFRSRLDSDYRVVKAAVNNNLDTGREIGAAITHLLTGINFDGILPSVGSAKGNVAIYKMKLKGYAIGLGKTATSISRALEKTEQVQRDYRDNPSWLPWRNKKKTEKFLNETIKKLGELQEVVNGLISEVEIGQAKVAEGLEVATHLHTFYEHLEEKNENTYKWIERAELVADLASNWVGISPEYFTKAFSGKPLYIYKVSKSAVKTVTYYQLEHKKHHLAHEREHLAEGGHGHEAHGQEDPGHV